MDALAPEAALFQNHLSRRPAGDVAHTIADLHGDADVVAKVTGSDVACSQQPSVSGAATSGNGNSKDDASESNNSYVEYSTNRAFVHEPLDHNAPSIRLIQILSDETSPGLLQCKVVHSTLEASYTCLSYVWGPPEPNCNILLDGKVFCVRKNLYEFLIAARKKERKTLFWIDALCIDQENVKERNHQVQQMGEVFSRAKEVIVWLGPRAELASLIRILRKEIAGLPLHEWTLIREKGDVMRDQLFFNEYWRRAWVTQEIILGGQVTALVDTEECPYKALVSGPSIYYLQNFDQCPLMQFTRAPDGLRGMCIVHLLSHFKDRACSVPRDRIFSLLSLCGEGKGLQVDYELPALELAYQIFTHCKKHVCLCTVALVAQSLDAVGGVSSDAILQVSYPYLEFDVLREPGGDGVWSVIANRSGYIPEGGVNTLYRFREACPGLNTTVIYWREGGDVGDEVPVWGDTLEMVGKQQIGTYGHGFRVLPKPGTRICSVRIAFSLFAKIAWQRGELCFSAKRDMEYEGKPFDRPRVGHT